MKQNLNFKNKIALIITLLGLISLMFGTSYAILKGNTLSEQEQIIKTGDVTLKITENFQNLNEKIKIMTDKEGMTQETIYEFNIKNIGSVNSRYKLRIVNEVSNNNENEILSLEYIKASLEINGEIFGPFALRELESTIDEGIINKNEVIDYKLRIWIDETKKEEIQNMADYKAYLKLKVDIQQYIKGNLDISGANEPILSKNMIPVYYDETCDNNTGCWRKADKNNIEEKYKWYNYDEKMWANSVTVSESSTAKELNLIDNTKENCSETTCTRNDYVNAPLGTKIPMEDILTMQVWIPRYKYKVWNYNLSGTVTSAPQEIQITFEKEKMSTGEISCIDNIQGKANGVEPTTSEICSVKITNESCTDLICNNKTYTHPAFTFGDRELKGIWVGKFELSSSTTCTPSEGSAVGSGCNITTIKPLSKPNVSSWRGAMSGTYENNMKAMNDDSNIYGFVSNDDTHMIKNMEWGAVTYLAHSKYGKNGEIELNSYSGIKTGCGPQSLGSTSSGSTCNAYNTTIGQAASTTGNVYGIYDMSGGLRDYVMATIISPNGTDLLVGYRGSTNRYSGYKGAVYHGNSIGDYASYNGTYTYPEDKYIDKYSFGSAEGQRNRAKLGDGIKEVFNASPLGWYSDYCDVGCQIYPWFFRGGYYNENKNAGLFNSNDSYGYANLYNGSRFAILQ